MSENWFCSNMFKLVQAKSQNFNQLAVSCSHLCSRLCLIQELEDVAAAGERAIVPLSICPWNNPKRIKQVKDVPLILLILWLCAKSPQFHNWLSNTFGIIWHNDSIYVSGVDAFTMRATSNRATSIVA